MRLRYEFNEDGTIRGAAYTGCSGLERPGNGKETLRVLQVDNPIVAFREAVQRGKYSDLPDEEYDQRLDSIRCISDLFHFPDDPPDAKAQRQLNVLSLLANAITKLVELDVAVRRYEEAEEP